MSVASWLHVDGISASFISNTTEPSALPMRLDRVVQSTVEKTSWSGEVKRREIFMVLVVLGRLASERGEMWNTPARVRRESSPSGDDRGGAGERA
jgi:hypothetical protein